MKNIQIIDGAINCVYDIYAAKDEEFAIIFPDGQDIEFIEDLSARVGEDRISSIMSEIWKRRLAKRDAQGIHGILFYELSDKKIFYPTKKDEEAKSPDGSRLR